MHREISNITTHSVLTKNAETSVPANSCHPRVLISVLHRSRKRFAVMTVEWINIVRVTHSFVYGRLHM